MLSVSLMEKKYILSSYVLTKARIYSSVSRGPGEGFLGTSRFAVVFRFTELGAVIMREAPPRTPLLC